MGLPFRGMVLGTKQTQFAVRAAGVLRAEPSPSAPVLNVTIRLFNANTILRLKFFSIIVRSLYSGTHSIHSSVLLFPNMIEGYEDHMVSVCPL